MLVDNDDHCDFVKLRQMLVRTHMEDLKEYTNDVLYENYRSQKMTSAGGASVYYSTDQANPIAKFEEEKKAHEAKLARMEAEMKQVFQQKVAEKETRLKQTEDEVGVITGTLYHFPSLANPFCSSSASIGR